MIILSWPSGVLSPNGRYHWSDVAKAKKAAKKEAWAATLASKTKPATSLHLTFCPPIKRARDLDNLIASMKPALDGMAQAWGVNDSTFRFTAEIGEIVPGGRVVVEAAE